MKKICTLFSRQQFFPTLLISAIYDTDHRDVEFLPLYIKGTGLSIKEINKNIDKIIQIMQTEEVIVDDVISHLLKINGQLPIITPKTNHQLYEAYLQSDNKTPESITDAKKILLKKMIQMPKKPAPWMRVKAGAGVVYAHLTSKGILCGPRHVYPYYDMGVLSGRSRTQNFNIQGTTDKDPIKHVNLNYTHFICFDWVSADLRMAGLLSIDQFINDTFKESDPYSVIEKLLSINNITRNDCKLELLQSIYKADLSCPLLEFMPGLKAWLAQKCEDFNNNYNFRTILGMPIPKNSIRTSINGIIQGSVAEALQSALIKIGEFNVDCILTEIHDSLIIMAREKEIPKTIKKIVPIMMQPFDNAAISLPVKVSIGKKWKQWKKYRIYR